MGKSKEDIEKFNKKIDSIIDCLTESNGCHAITESDIRDAISELKELKELYK